MSAGNRPIRRIFIANRGEIARRIGLTCKKMGIRSVAVMVDDAPPEYLVGVVDEFVRLPNRGTATFLDQKLMINTALKARVDAVHPGFGFLSEHAEFAKSVVDAGLIWIGPHHDSIHKMANKDKARRLAEQHDVPLVPGMQVGDEEALTPALVRSVSDFGHRVGFPLLIKAALGGGGKGMRLVHEHDDIEELLRRASSEALSSFADGRLIVEKYVDRPRHIEVQVLGDQHGRILTLSERDCSVQRRHQKIIEEAPAVGLNEATRAGLHEAALRVAKAAKYANAGTVEFLVDWSNPSENQAFYFLEMNTRLQVEHPVTEEIHGLDLVHWQIRIAEGAELPERFELVSPEIHSIEARLYAEDPAQNFLPAPGKVRAFVPFQGEQIRWEIGLDPIDAVTPQFDPMVAKVVATGESRQVAIGRLKEALAKTMIAGVANNRAYLMAIADDQHFAHDIPTTKYISERHDSLLHELSSARESRTEAADELLNDVYYDLNRRLIGSKDESKLRRTFAKHEIGLVADETHRDVRDGGRQVLVTGTVAPRRWPFVGPLPFAHHRSASADEIFVLSEGLLFGKSFLRHESEGGDDEGVHHDQVLAPVPGKVVKILGASGDAFAKNQTVIILESMKMEFEIKATRDGVLDDVVVEIGQQVESEQVLASWQTE